MTVGFLLARAFESTITRYHDHTTNNTNTDGSLVSPGLLTLKYDGKTIYKGRDLGNGIEAYIGDGCE